MQAMKSRFKKHLVNLGRTRAGAYRDSSSGLFLDRNERIVPFDAKTLKSLCRRIVKSSFNLYPDVDLFYEKVAKWLGVCPEMIYVTEGVSGAIKAMIETIAEPGDNIIFPVPTFALYPVYCRMFKIGYRTFGYTKDYRLDVDKMLSLMDKRTSIVFLPNPNVPIEGTLNLKAIKSITARCRENNTFLVIDEVYFPFGGPTAINIAEEFENLFIMRSFSKAFGLAGIRLGYVVGQSKNIEYISKTRTGYESNTLSMETASFFIDNYHIVEDYIKDVKEGLAYLKKGLNKLGLEFNGGDTSNFLYVELRDRELVEKIADALKKRNIYIRSNWPKPYAGGFSISGAPKDIMRQFLNELSTALCNMRGV
jgi:histidinol-phosphate aminotransferase